MKLKIIREFAQVDENRQIRIDVPPDMGNEFEVILMPVRSGESAGNLSEEDLFNLSAYAAVVDEDLEEDSLWERYIHA